MTQKNIALGQGKEVQGAIALVLSSLAFSLMTVCVKQLGGRIPVSEIVLVRSLISIALTGVGLRLAGVDPFGKNRRLLVLRGVCGSIALLCFFRAITDLPLASATVLQYTHIQPGIFYQSKSCQRNIFTRKIHSISGVKYKLI